MKLKKVKIKFYAFVSFMLFIIFISIILHLNGYDSVLYENLEGTYGKGFLSVAYLLLYAISAILPIPFLSILGATIFPFWEGFILANIGSFLLFTIGFYFTRWFGRDYIKIYEKTNPKIKKININFSKNSFFYLFYTRLFFIIPPQIINIFAGLSKVKFKDYIIPSLLGHAIVILISIFLIKGYQTRDLTLVIVSLFFLAGLILLPAFKIKSLRRFIKRK